MSDFFADNEDKFIPEPSSGCWIWLGATKDGYGIVMSPRAGLGIRAKRKQLLAHRLAYAAYHGPIAEGMQVRHRCDNTYCINPEHLCVGTHDDNMADKASRGRAHRPCGASNPKAKLSMDDVFSIRARYRKGLGKTLAAEYGVAVGTIIRAAYGVSWQ